MKCFFILLDGLGDRGYDVFNGKTPLCAAFTPNLDYIAQIGSTGIYHPYKIGLSLPSELAHFLMFGYEIEEFPGRGILEALGNDILVERDDVVLMARILEVEQKDENLIVVNEKPTIEYEIVNKLIEPIKCIHIDNIVFKLYLIKGTFCLLVLSNGASKYISDSNPIHKGYPIVKVKPLKGYKNHKKAIKTARALNKYIKICYRHLNRGEDDLDNKDYIIATQRPGKIADLPSFKSKWGFNAISISSSKLYRGLAKIIEMESFLATPIKDAGKDLLNKIKLAYELKDYEFIHIHTKVPDEAAHTKDPIRKKNAIESLDIAFKFVINNILSDKKDLVVIVSDHSTPSCGKMIHSGEVVPLVFAGKGVRVDDVDRFDEISCANGSMGLIKGHELIYMILNLMDRGRLMGLADCEDPPLYFPGNFEPLNFNE